MIQMKETEIPILPFSPQGQARVDLTFPLRDWSDDDFFELNQMDFSGCRGREFRLAGKAPLWLYMFCALRGAASDASAIRVVPAELPAGVAVRPCSVGAHPLADAAEIQHTETETIVEFNGCGTLRFVPEQLPDLIADIPPPENGKSLVLTGIMPIFLAAAAALEAMRIGWRDIRYWSPRDPGIYRIFPDLRMFDAHPANEEHTVIGVVGDPNSGKSVFSELLETSGRICGQRLWTLDCDYAAPTPRWYLQMLRNGQQEAAMLRQKCKRKWTPEAERLVAGILQNMKRHAVLTIADLPGGIHPQDEPPECGVRIPPGREQMMKEVDFFIVIDRPDRNSGRLWRAALARFGLEDRIILSVRSEAPDAALSLREVDDRTLAMTGLIREHGTPSEKLLQRLWSAVNRALKANGNAAGPIRNEKFAKCQNDDTVREQ